MYVYLDNDEPFVCLSKQMKNGKRKYAERTLTNLVFSQNFNVSISVEDESWSCVAPLVFIQRET